MTFKQIIDIADSSYPDGLVGLYFERPDQDHGDTLARFIASELRDTYDGRATGVDQLRTARAAIGRAVDELQAVRCALDKAIGALIDQEVLDAQEKPASGRRRNIRP